VSYEQYQWCNVKVAKVLLVN